MRGMLVILSGPSGSGKGTVVKQLDPAKGYALSISATTRSPRPGEVDGRDYFFCTPEAFVKMREQHALLEYTEYVGHYYGTPRHYVAEQIAQGRVVVLEIEVNGALQVKAQFPDAILIFMIPPSQAALAERLALRNTEDADKIAGRLKRAIAEVALIPQYDYLVVNDTVAAAVEQIDCIVAAESLRPKRNVAAIQQFMQKE